ncbi:sugar ABC transporter [Acinetobacter populi]|uniref:Sugar ABC transporter n=1 Tax=Acinetobacter populi TaxID=1582270 RepID=A0A1Z9YUR4_9GAMM|nr:sugar ABC transporter [Acinetobacter populi]OUY05958.1 sugar ABC transporter [Acinetobacter populi]
MLYTVECTYTDPNTEEEWNDFYSRQKLSALISVTGFLTSQRFKAISSGGHAYLAIHTIEDEKIIVSEEYKQKGGGNFSSWQPYITDWHRNLYAFTGAAPAVMEKEILLLSTGLIEFNHTQQNYKPMEMYAVGLDQFPAYRVAYILPHQEAELHVNKEGVILYEAMTKQLQSSNDNN